MKLKAPAFAPGFFVSAILGCTPLDPGCVIGDLVDVEEDRARNVRGELLLEAFAIFCRQIARAVDDHDAGIAKVFGELVGGDKPTAVGDRGLLIGASRNYPGDFCRRASSVIINSR
jgi:hypothetical protein